MNTTNQRMVWKGALVYAALGPGVALGLILLMAAFVMIAKGEFGSLRDLGIVVVIGLPAAYLIGAIPAGITGAIAGALRPRMTRAPLIAWTMLAGACTSMGVGALSQTPRGVLAMAMIGACTAGLVTLQFLRLPRPALHTAPPTA